MNPNSSSFLLFAFMELLWMIGIYVLPACDRVANCPPVRHNKRPFIRRLLWLLFQSTALGVLSASLGGFHLAWWLGIAFACATMPLPFFHRWLPDRYHAELEIGYNLVAATLFWAIAGRLSLALTGLGPVHLTGLHPRRAVWILSLAILILNVSGGTRIVRGILARAGVMPETTDEDKTKHRPASLRHGKLIGNVERIILAVMVANGQYTALAFFFAGKGLIRSKDLDSRPWVDYLLLGSLSSFLVALAAGLLIGALFSSITVR